MNNKNRSYLFSGGARPYTEPSDELNTKINALFGKVTMSDFGNYLWWTRKLYEYTYRNEFYTESPFYLLTALERYFYEIGRNKLTVKHKDLLIENVLTVYSVLGDNYTNIVFAVLDLFIMNGVHIKDYSDIVDKVGYNKEKIHIYYDKKDVIAAENDYIRRKIIAEQDEDKADLNYMEQNIASSTASNEVVSDATANVVETPSTRKNGEFVNNYLDNLTTESESKVEKELPTRNTFKSRYLDAIGKNKGGSKTRNQNKKKRRSNKRRDSKKRRR